MAKKADARVEQLQQALARAQAKRADLERMITDAKAREKAERDAAK
jgi:ribosomal protein L17